MDEEAVPQTWQVSAQADHLVIGVCDDDGRPAGAASGVSERLEPCMKGSAIAPRTSVRGLILLHIAHNLDRCASKARAWCPDSRMPQLAGDMHPRVRHDHPNARGACARRLEPSAVARPIIAGTAVARSASDDWCSAGSAALGVARAMAA